jgi:hypothetical protein
MDEVLKGVVRGACVYVAFTPEVAAQPIHNPANGHLYELVLQPGVTWTEANNAAAARPGGWHLVDLVWQNIADGRVAAWLMNGLTQQTGALLSIPSVPDLDWRIRSIGDLNGDGRADLFWQHEGDGRIAVWLMNGFNVISGNLLNPGTGQGHGLENRRHRGF